MTTPPISLSSVRSLSSLKSIVSMAPFLIHRQWHFVYQKNDIFASDSKQFLIATLVKMCELPGINDTECSRVGTLLAADCTEESRLTGASGGRTSWPHLCNKAGGNVHGIEPFRKAPAGADPHPAVDQTHQRCRRRLCPGEPGDAAERGGLQFPALLRPQ